MEYQLKAEVAPPAGTPELDALHRHGVVSLLDEQLDLLAGIEGPDGVEIEPLDHEVTAHAGGASISWLVDAPALVFAEEAARAVLAELLERTDLLSSWAVVACEVTVSDEDLETALEDGEEAQEDEDLEITLLELTGEERDERRELLLTEAELVQALGKDAFGGEDGVEDEHAELIAGAVAEAIVIMIDELFEDIQVLDQEDTTADEHEDLMVVDELPGAFTDQYSAWFAKRFLMAAIIVGQRLTEAEWTVPQCPAEALVLHLVKARAEAELTAGGLLDEETLKRAFAAFDEHAFADMEHEALYAEDAEGTVVEWLPGLARA